MKRLTYLVLSVGAAGLMIMLLVMTIGAQAPDKVGGATIKVPDDYPTIQAAIDAAEEGDTILVAGSDYNYKENLFITEGITLSGGWNEDFTEREPGSSAIDGQGQGRVVNITTDSESTVVTIDGFTIVNGDASGLGIPALPELSDAVDHTAVSGIPEAPVAAQSLDPAEQMDELRTRVAGLAARGLYPGGERALQLMLEQLNWRAAQAEEARALARAMPALDKDAVEADPGAGGGIYSWNASLHLLNSTVEFNVGSTGDAGYGGGIFAGQGETITISGNVIGNNTAGMRTDGRGGGLYLTHAASAVVEDNLFLENAASNGGGKFGTGGGLYVSESSGVLVQGNKFLRNTAHASWDCGGLGGGGNGGGAHVNRSDSAIVKDNTFHNNLSALHCGSHTGGLYVYDAADVQVIDNELIDNWGVLFQIYSDDYGGGLGLDTLTNATVTGNTVRSNVTSLATQEGGWTVSYGGGIYGHMLSDSHITSNTISANTASIMLTAFGGGMYLEATNNVVVADNIVTDNTASLSDLVGGNGGGLDLRNPVGTLVQGNHFQGNKGGASGDSEGGALKIASWGPNSFDNTVDGNLFLGNQASGDVGERSRGGACVIGSNGLTFTNNVVAGNEAHEAGGIILDMAVNGEVTNNTLVGNSDAAILLAEWTTPVSFTNNIIVDHSVGISVTEVATATVSYTLWDGNDTNIIGSGTYTETYPVKGDPVFVDAAKHDYHLAFGSAAIDAGDPAGVPPAPDHDADGLARPQWTAVDIGAYEWPGFQQYLPVIMNQWEQVIGWAVGDPADGYCTILKTTDGGDTWQRQGGPGELPDTECGSVSAIDADNAWVVSNISILRTRDGGLTWETQVLPDGLPPETEFEWIKAIDGDTAWAVGYPDVLLGTTDGGGKWSIMPRTADLHLDTPVQYSDVDAIDATHVWAVGSHGPDAGNVRDDTVIAFFDGTEWQRQGTGVVPIGNGHSFIGVSVVDEDNVWAVGGQDLPLVKTADGGATWQQVGPALNPFDTNRVVAVTADTGWVTADSGGLRRTDDGGQTWVNADSGTSDYIYGITAMNAQTAWAVSIPYWPSTTGHILRTKDGQNWESRLSPVEVSLSGISFVGARR